MPVITATYKTRYVDDILAELFATLDIHESQGSLLHGIHLETTHEENVVECLDYREAAQGIHNYKSPCDPRLNRRQTLEVVRRFLEYRSRSIH